ncbi:MAG: FG-GAP repeat protein, partial [Chloroflexi bacterium]|nr:FG-GAP repeat protein [Chloroflexota bacterium]
MPLASSLSLLVRSAIAALLVLIALVGAAGIKSEQRPVEAALLSELRKLTASDAEEYDVFGASVAVSGDTAVIGAVGEDTEGDHNGAVYIFERDQGGADNWGEVKKLTTAAAHAGGSFGKSVAISGDTVVVGEHAGSGHDGAAYVFERDSGGANNWGKVKKLTASDAELGDQFGYSVTLSGDTAV